MTTLKLGPADTIAGALSEIARNYPGRLALAVARKGGRRRANGYDEVSLSDVERDSATFAQMFRHSGIERGTRTVLMIPPGRDFCGALFGLLRVGAVPVFVDPGIGLRNVGHCIRQAMPEAFVGIQKAQIARHLLGWGRESIRVSITPGVDPRMNRKSLARAANATSDDDLAAIAFTSGSTGPPKGVAFDHANLLAQTELAGQLLGPYSTQPHLSTFPLFLLFGPLLGFPVIVPNMDTSRPARANPAELISAIEDYRCQSMFASPVLVRKLGSYCAETGRRLPTIGRVLSAGAPSDPDVLSKLAVMIAPGGEIHTPYGATEALPVSNLSSKEILGETGQMTRSGAGVCVGRPMPGIKASIIPIVEKPIAEWDEVELLPPGEIGEIAVSGPVVSRLYYNNPEATRYAKIPCRASRAFYHRMGDLGYFDQAGRLWMCGRKSHRVVTPARVYFTIPTEGVFNSHPDVARTALVGVTQDGATIPVVCVEPSSRKSAAGKQHIAADLRVLGGKYAHTSEIRHFLFQDSFPVDARHNSKIRREDLAVWASRKIDRRDLAAKEIHL